jgi:hypothetical protein
MTISFPFVIWDQMIIHKWNQAFEIYPLATQQYVSRYLI